MIELQWRRAKPDDAHKVMMLCGDNYVSMVLQYRLWLQQSFDPNKAYWEWTEWQDVPAAHKE